MELEQLEKINDEILSKWSQSELCEKITFVKIVNGQIHYNTNEKYFASSAINRIIDIIKKHDLIWHISNYSIDDYLLFVIYK